MESIKLKEKLGYGMGDFASNLIYSGITSFLIYYYTDVAGIAAATVGLILMISRILDAFVDIAMGIFVDKTKSKHGKARPWLMWMAIPFALSAVLLFSVPDVSMTTKIIYAFITYNIVNIIYAAINIPYGVLNSLMTQDQYQRSVLNIFRMCSAIFGALFVSMATMPLVEKLGGGAHAWQIAFGIYGVIAAVMFLVVFKTTKERVRPAAELQQDVPVRVGVKALFQNKYWILVLVLMIVTYIGNGLAGVNVYFAQYMLNDAGLLGIISMVTMIPLILGMFFVAPIIKRFGKRNSIVWGMGLTIIGGIVVATNPQSLTIVLVGGVIKSLGVVPLSACMFAMLADTIEYGEWKSGVRSEGLVYSAGSFGTKVGAGIGAGITGLVLSMGGYAGEQATQSASALASINMLYIYIPLALTVIQIVLLMFYKLDKQYPQIVKELEERKGNKQ